MKVPVWMCTGCQFIGLRRACILTYITGDNTPEKCPKDIEWCNFSYRLIEYTEIAKYFSTQCKNYSLTPICSLRHGICPSGCDGQEEGCREKKRILQ